MTFWHLFMPGIPILIIFVCFVLSLPHLVPYCQGLLERKPKDPVPDQYGSILLTITLHTRYGNLEVYKQWWPGNENSVYPFAKDLMNQFRGMTEKFMYEDLDHRDYNLTDAFKYSVSASFRDVGKLMGFINGLDVKVLREEIDLRDKYWVLGQFVLDCLIEEQKYH